MSQSCPDTAPTLEEDGEALMKDLYEAMLNSQQRSRLNEYRQCINAFATICSISSAVATPLVLIILLLAVWHQLGMKSQCADIPDHQLIEEETHEMWKEYSTNSAEARRLHG